MWNWALTIAQMRDDTSLDYPISNRRWKNLKDTRFSLEGKCMRLMMVYRYGSIERYNSHTLTPFWIIFYHCLKLFKIVLYLFWICIIFLSFILFIILREWGRGREERESQAGSAMPTQGPAWGSNPRTTRSWPELKPRAGRSTYWATQAPPSSIIFDLLPVKHVSQEITMGWKFFYLIDCKIPKHILNY